MRTQLVCGTRQVPVTLPDDAVVIKQGQTVPLEPVADLPGAVEAILDAPLESPPLSALARPGLKVTLAFDDPTVPCFAPVWATAIPAVVQVLTAAGVALEDIHLLCANALHRKFTDRELAGILGPPLVKAFAGRLTCHDAEDPDGIVDLGDTPSGLPVEVNRRLVDSDLTVYLNAACWRAFNGGWKSICVGLSTYRSIRVHHNPDDMSMSTDRNRMHAMLDEMGARVVDVLGPDRIFKIETVLANPMQVGRMWAGSVDATRRALLDLVRATTPPRRDLADERFDIVLYGVPEWSPYAAFAGMNPLLRLVSTGLGYLGGPIQAVGAEGCSVIMATPCPDEWDDTHHPSYREVWDSVLSETLDPYEICARYLDDFAGRQDYLERYRHRFGFHPSHGIMATFPLKRLRHAGRVFVAGAENDHLVRHLGFIPAATIDEAIGQAREHHGADARIGVIAYPFAMNRA